MSTTCSPAPENKKEYIADIGKILVSEHGRKDFYTPKEVEEAHQKSKWYENADFSCWAMCTFSSHQDFDTYHQEIGETCDYTAMKSEMFAGLSPNLDVNTIDASAFDMDTSWLDIGEVSGDGFLEGLLEFFSSILD